MLKKSTCFLCGSTKTTTIYHGIRGKVVVTDDTTESINHSIDVIKCTDCGLVRLSLFPNNIDDFYSKSGMRDFCAIDLAEEQKRNLFDYERQFNETKQIINGKNVIDFGCGGYISFAKNSARSIIGIEMEDDMRQQLNEMGYCSYKTIDMAKKADIITMFHVLAHLENPENTIRAIKEHLEPNGLIYIETPNLDDALLSIYHCKAFETHAFHQDMLWYFNEDSLVKLAKKCDFEIECIKHIQRYPLTNHLYWLSEGKPGGRDKMQELNSAALDSEYSKALAKLKKLTQLSA